MTQKHGVGQIRGLANNGVVQNRLLRLAHTAGTVPWRTCFGNSLQLTSASKFEASVQKFGKYELHLSRFPSFGESLPVRSSRDAVAEGIVTEAPQGAYVRTSTHKVFMGGKPLKFLPADLQSQELAFYATEDRRFLKGAFGSREKGDTEPVNFVIWTGPHSVEITSLGLGDTHWLRPTFWKTLGGSISIWMNAHWATRGKGWDGKLSPDTDSVLDGLDMNKLGQACPTVPEKLASTIPQIQKAYWTKADELVAQYRDSADNNAQAEAAFEALTHETHQKLMDVLEHPAMQQRFLNYCYNSRERRKLIFRHLRCNLTVKNMISCVIAPNLQRDGTFEPWPDIMLTMKLDFQAESARRAARIYCPRNNFDMKYAKLPAFNKLETDEEKNAATAAFEAKQRTLNEALNAIFTDTYFNARMFVSLDIFQNKVMTFNLSQQALSVIENCNMYSSADCPKVVAEPNVQPGLHVFLTRPKQEAQAPEPMLVIPKKEKVKTDFFAAELKSKK